MVFVPPYTNTVVFLDNYHPNYGGPGYDIETGTPSKTSYVYDDEPQISVFGTELDLVTYHLRTLRPKSDTFCSAGSFYGDGTLLNVAGAEAGPSGVAEGFDKVRTYKPGPCGETCAQDWDEQAVGLQHYRWYPTAQTLVDGEVLVVGGSSAGGLVVNEENINVPTYEILYQDVRPAPKPVNLPILDFSQDENDEPGFSYNLYPMRKFESPASLETFSDSCA